MSSEHVLCLHNDEVNNFNYVIDALMEVCEHTSDQAEQCACITHYKGKSELKIGRLDVLSLMRDKLEKKGLIVSVEINKTAY